MHRSLTTSLRALFLSSGIILVLMFALGSDALVTAAYQGHSLALLNRLMENSAMHPLPFYLRKSDNVVLYLAFLWLCAGLAWGVSSRRLSQQNARGGQVGDGVVFVLCLAAVYVFLVRYGHEAEWYSIKKIMSYAGKPPFQHRVMFVVPANAMHAFFPSLETGSCFLAAQVLAAALALWAVKRFSSLFIRADMAFVSQLLLVAVWAPTQRYFTFYDIGIMFVFSFCLYHLLRQEFRPYLLMLALGTFNHETTLFLIGVSALLFYRRMNLPALGRFLVLQLVLYGLVRAFLFYCLPANSAWEGGKLPYNIFLLTQRQFDLLLNLGPSIIWLCIAALGWRHAPRDLRCCVVVLPCLLVMTFLVGQVQEARQFDAFLPIAVALICCAVAYWCAALPESPLLGGRSQACAGSEEIAKRTPACGLRICREVRPPIVEPGGHGD